MNNTIIRVGLLAMAICVVATTGCIAAESDEAVMRAPEGASERLGSGSGSDSDDVGATGSGSDDGTGSGSSSDTGSGSGSDGSGSGSGSECGSGSGSGSDDGAREPSDDSGDEWDGDVDETDDGCGSGSGSGGSGSGSAESVADEMLPAAGSGSGGTIMCTPRPLRPCTCTKVCHGFFSGSTCEIGGDCSPGVYCDWARTGLFEASRCRFYKHTVG